MELRILIKSSVIVLIYLSNIFFPQINETSASKTGAGGANKSPQKVTTESTPLKDTSGVSKPNITTKSEAEHALEINRNGKEHTTKNGTIIVSNNQTVNNNRDVIGGNLLGTSPIPKTFAVTFYLYTQQNPNDSQTITYTTLPSETFWNISEKCIVLIHGYTQSDAPNDALSVEGAKTSTNIKRAFMESNRTENIVIMDWHEASREVNYFVAAQNTWIIGQTLGDMLISLKDRGFLNYSQVYLVGFSLGAQLSGVAGYTVTSKTNNKIGRITGLDPAGPGFETSVDLMRRLDPTDADYVDVIHCNAGYLLPYRQLGTLIDCGHIDFYPNGGTKQPGCAAQDYPITSCSHLKCTQFYASSVRGTLYPGCECADKITFDKGECTTCNGPPMGYMLPINSTGKYFLKGEPEAQDNYEGVIEIKRKLKKNNP